MTSKILYNTSNLREHCRLQAFEQFGALCMHNLHANIRPGRDSKQVLLIKKNEWGSRPPSCTYRLKWARRTSWGWWGKWDDTALQTQDTKLEPWQFKAENATYRLRGSLQFWIFASERGRNILFLWNLYARAGFELAISDFLRRQLQPQPDRISHRGSVS